MPLYCTFVITLCSITVTKAGQMLLSLYALSLGAQPLTVGIIAATYSAFPMLLSWQAGRLADRFGFHWLVLGGLAGGACGMVVPYYLPGLPAIYIATVFNGLMHASTDVCLQSLVGQLSNPHDRSRNFSNFSLVVSVAGFLGPLMAGFSIDLSGHAVACLYLAALLLVPITMMMTYTSSAAGRSGEAMGLRLTVNHLTRVIVPLFFGMIGSTFGMYPVFFVNALMLASGGVATKPGSIDGKCRGDASVK